ncbi:MAG: PAS domain-containing protein, partial [bacterium]
IQTVNNQLEQKVTELEATNNDLNNLLASTDIATVFLDRGFCLKRFTPATKRLLRVIESDVGRPIRDFALNFTDPELLADAERVLQQLAPIEREVDATEGRHYLRRILPYRTEDARIVGVVITFDDVTNAKEHERALERLAEDLDERVRKRTAELEAANAALRESEEWLSLAVHGTGMGSWDLDLRTGTGRWSKNHFEIMDYEAVSGGEATMEMWRSRIHPGDRERVERELEEARCERSLFASEHRILRGPEAEPRWLSALGRFFYEGDEAVRFVGVVQDITERKRLEWTITELAEKERQRLGRELHDALGQQMSAIGMLAAALASELHAGTPGADTAKRLESMVDRAKTQIASVAGGLLRAEVDAGGLCIALEALAREVTDLYGIRCRVEAQGRPQAENDFAATQLYFIASEAAHNAARHAGVEEIVIRLEDRDGVHVSVRDQGVGITPESAKSGRGFGMDIMRHRCALSGGVLQIESPPEGGTRVSCFIPKGADGGAR